MTKSRERNSIILLGILICVAGLVILVLTIIAARADASSHTYSTTFVFEGYNLDTKHSTFYLPTEKIDVLSMPQGSPWLCDKSAITTRDDGKLIGGINCWLGDANIHVVALCAPSTPNSRRGDAIVGAVGTSSIQFTVSCETK